MATNLIFTESIAGHRLEYLHHIYNKSITNHRDIFLFLVPDDFRNKRDLFSWDESPNIKILILNEKDTKSCNSGSLFKRCIAICYILRKYIIKEKVDKIFLLTLMLAMPFISLVIPSNVKVSGIIYKIYLYENRRTLFRHIIDSFIYKLFIHAKCMDKLFVLNDKRSVNVLNDRYKTNQFIYLPDPIPNIDVSKLSDMRKTFNIKQNDKVFLQFGSLDRRKNTITILKAIDLMSVEELYDKVFIFSGKLYSNIEYEFNYYIEKLQNKAQVIYLKGFLSYETLNNLCYTSDYIFTLYENVAQSSGTIGYAAFFKKPVIGTSKGMLGNLIIDNKLGYVIDDITPISIKNIIQNDLYYQENNYKETHTVDNFCDIIFNCF